MPAQAEAFSFTRRPVALGAMLAAALCVAGCGGGGDDDDAPPRQAMTCAQLNGMTVAAGSIGLATTGAVVTSATVVPAAGSGATAVGEYCRVLGDIRPVDTRAQSIKFQLNLPTAWNGKAMMFGGGGYNGTLATGAGNVPAGPADK
ncbi:MAG: tannase/feruloyl esterase family alpha/beta hydrolase, partial [Variovorax sp.]